MSGRATFEPRDEFDEWLERKVAEQETRPRRPSTEQTNAIDLRIDIEP